MKRLLLLAMLSVICLTISAQTKTWTGPSGGSFNSAANWNPVGIPGSTHDVVIPTGSNITMDGANIKSFVTQGNTSVTITNQLNVSSASTISSNTTITWNSGNLAGLGTMTNNGTINMMTATNRALQSTFTLINNGTLNVNSSGDFTLGNGTPTLHNASSGVINLNSAGKITYSQGSGTVINSGLINKAQNTGMYQILTHFENNGGTISVDSGTLNLNTAIASLTDGTYNVAAGSALDLSSTYTISGTLTGVLNGNLNLTGTLTVDPGTSATLDFNGPEAINWSSGHMNGNGTFTNMGEINLIGAAPKYIQGTSTFNNEGVINVNSSGDFVLGNGTPTLNNTATGLINLNSGGELTFSQGAGTLVNSGTIKKLGTNDLYEVIANFTNNDGTISVEQGTLRFNTANAILNDGEYHVSSGSVLEFASTMKLLGTLVGQIDGQLHWVGTLKVEPATVAVLNFTGPSGIDWSNGYFNGNGTLTNMGEINLIGENSKYIQGTSTFNNEGVINVNSSGDFVLGNGTPTLNNTATGLINLNSGGELTFSQGAGTLINSGTIKKLGTTDLYEVIANFTNNDGMISVEQGTLKFNTANAILNDGEYHVSSGSILEFASTIKLLGTLTGQLDGQLHWVGTLKVEPETDAVLDFNGPSGIDWSNGYFNGNGTLTNMGKINLIGANSKYIQGTSVFNNEGTVNIESEGILILGNGMPTFNNLASGIINLNEDSSISFSQGVGTIVNSGWINKEESIGNFTISANTNNIYPGKIMCENGLLSFGTYVGDGILGGNGSVKLQANTIFEGIISPGSSTGTLTHVGNYISSENAILAIEIDGLSPGTEYDVFNVDGSATVEGGIDLTLGYEAELNDEFIVLTANNISSCNLPATLTVYYDNHDYTFDVICNSDNVKLLLTNIVLGVEENSLSNLSMYPNPTNGDFTIDLGKEYSDITIQIYNMLGQVISSNKYLSAKIIEQEINVSAGIYFVKVNTATEGSKIFKIIKQ